MQKTRVLSLVVAMSLAHLASVSAQSAGVWSDDELAAASSAVVIGRVADLRSGRALETGAAQSYVTIAVSETIRGAIAEREITLKQPVVDGQAAFTIGEQVLVFLETSLLDGTLSTAGLWQGKWTVETDANREQQAVRFDADSASRALFRGLGDRRALSQLIERVRALNGNAPASARPFVTQPSAEEMRGAAHEPAPAATTSAIGRTTASAALVPNAPSGLSTVVSGSSVKLSWQAPPGPVSSYLIEAGSSRGLSNLANFATGNPSTTYGTSGVGPGIYYVRVRAVNGDGVGAPSNEIVVNVGGGCSVPGPPTNLRLVSAAGGTVILQWDLSPLAYTFVIEAGAAPGLANLANSDTGSNAPSLTATGVAPGRYYVRVRAKVPCGVSGPSNEVLVIVGGGTQATIEISFSPNPAEVVEPNGCYRSGLGGSFSGPQWWTTIKATNTGGVGMAVSRWRRLQYDSSGTLLDTISWNQDTFRTAFTDCNDRSAFFSSGRIEPGQQLCFVSCFYRRTTTGSQTETLEGVDDLGHAVNVASRISFPTWSALTTAPSQTPTIAPLASPVPFESLRPRR